MTLLTGKIISLRKFIPIMITQKVIDRVEYLATKYGIKSPLKFKYSQEGGIIKNDDENNYDNG